MFQPAVVGVGEAAGAAGEVDQEGAAATGLARAGVVVVTEPAELPCNQVAPDCCQ